LRESEISIKHVSEVFAGLAVLVFIFSTVMSTFNYNEEKYKYVAKFPYKTTESYNGQDFTHIWLGTLCFGLILAAVYLAGIYLYSTVKKKKDARIISLFMAALVIFEAGYNTYDTIWKIHKEVYYSDHKTYDVIKDAYKVVDELEKKDSSFYRSEKTFFRTVNDNQAWGLKGISHSSSVMNGRILRFIETLGYSFKTYETRYDGNTPVADSLLGIKYVFDDPAKHTEGNKKSLLSPYYNKIYSTTYTDDSSKQATLDVYENPDALPIGFMADDDITMLSFLGNDNPFNSMNNFLSSMTGNTPSYTGALEPKEYFKRIEIDPSTDVVLNDCWESDYGGQHCYNANAGAGDPTVRIHLTTQSDDALYMFLKSDNAKKSNLWVSTTKNAETGEFEDFSSYGSYYDGYDYSIVNLGKFPKGTEMEVRLTILPTGDGGAYVGSNEYIMIKDFQFYHLDYETFHNDISALKEHPWVLDMNKTKDNYLTGEIDAQEGQIMYTSIPYEPGWTIKVDGKKVDPLYVEADTADGTKRMQNTVAGDLGSIVILDAMIGLRLPAGHHTVTMKYSPPGFNTGIILLLLGIAACVAFYITDRKSNPVMIAERKAKERRKAGLPEVSAADGKKPVQIIKSKGSEVAAKAEAVKDKAAEKAEQAAEAVKETAKDAGKTVKKEVSKPAPKKNNGGKKKKKK
ncbi:MAG TPA: YfhO family protein, partial [Ruminococcus flavefaciens]|nr:YfhO family protein [Ruminococcus flavefaciens]